jgi:hypothetical protein
MMFYITSLDGSIHSMIEAEDAGAACDELAHRLSYSSYEAMCKDLDYGPGSLSIGRIERGDKTGASKAESKKHIGQQVQSAVINAFTQQRRAG